MKRTKLSAWLLTVVVFLISLGVIYWVGVPLGNPDANVLLAVEVVLAAAFAMFVNAIAYPQSRIGDQTGLGAPSVSFTVAVVTLAIAGLAAAFVGLRHPMVAAWLAVPHASLLGRADQEPPECLHDLEGGARRGCRERDE